MKKVWETERLGPHVHIICSLEFSDGRRGGVRRCVRVRQWNELCVAAKHEYLIRSIQLMDRDILQIGAL